MVSIHGWILMGITALAFMFCMLCHYRVEVSKFSSKKQLSTYKEDELRILFWVFLSLTIIFAGMAIFSNSADLREPQVSYTRIKQIRQVASTE